METGRLLQTHAVGGRVVINRTPENFLNYENTRLAVFEGWR
jgi:hypothetical protein